MNSRVMQPDAYQKHNSAMEIQIVPMERMRATARNQSQSHSQQVSPYF